MSACAKLLLIPAFRSSGRPCGGFASTPKSVVIGDSKDAVANRLRINDATPPEIAFLMTGQRVEVNSMTSDQFVRFVEDKHAARGFAKVVPEMAMLAET